MVICRKPLILATDLAGALLVLGLAATMTFLVVLPYCREHWQLPARRRTIAAVQGHSHQLAAQNTASTAAIRELERHLSEQGGAATNDVGSILEDMAQRCGELNITLEQFEPVAPVSGAQFSSLDVRITARGRFPEFQRLLLWIEARSEYTHVREIDVLQVAGVSECRLSWTVRVNYVPEPSPAEEDRT